MAIKGDKTRGKKASKLPVENTAEKQGENILRLVETMQREKNIPRDVIFNGIEAAIQLALQRGSSEDEDFLVRIDPTSGEIIAQKGDKRVEPGALGRIAAQAAKQVMIQKIREAESEEVYGEFKARRAELVIGTIQRLDNGTAIVMLTKDAKTGSGQIEALLPRSEMIPGQTHHVNERVKAVVKEVKRNGNRVKIVLSRNHSDFVRALFEQEIPEIQDRTIEIKAVAREPGQRSKVAVSSIDLKVDCVGACVGVRGSRIKNVTDELPGERIDIVRWNDSMQVLIPNALQPADISEVMLYPRIGKAIVLVTEDQLSLAIGRRGQNVRLASRLVGWDIDIMTHDELAEDLEKGEHLFALLPHSTPELTEALITDGCLNFGDVVLLEPDEIVEMLAAVGVEMEESQADAIIRAAEKLSPRAFSDLLPNFVSTSQQAAAAEAEAAEAQAGEEGIDESDALEETVESLPEVVSGDVNPLEALMASGEDSLEETTETPTTQETTTPHATSEEHPPAAD
jgi:transcription termination/antitermination protein NusA